MLEPGQRQLLTEALRPPEGYRFDCAVVTTYTLDLLTLLGMLRTFTLYHWAERPTRATDPRLLPSRADRGTQTQFVALRLPGELRH